MVCQCQVCLALAGLRPRDATPEVLAQLPEPVRQILGAQERVRLRRPRPGDVEIVKKAAMECRANQFARPDTEH